VRFKELYGKDILNSVEVTDVTQALDTIANTFNLASATIFRESDTIFLKNIFDEKETTNKVILEDVYIKIIPSNWKIYDEDSPEIWHFVVAT